MSFLSSSKARESKCTEHACSKTTKNGRGERSSGKGGPWGGDASVGPELDVHDASKVPMAASALHPGVGPSSFSGLCSHFVPPAFNTVL